MAAELRIVTFNAAVGNPRITTPEEAFLELPFYREALAGGDGAPLLALQEVGPAQARALRRAAGPAVVLQARRPGQGNALIVPPRYEVLSRRAGYYARSHARGVGRALRAGRRNWRQYGELRMWIRARLRDREAGRELTVLTTHVSFDRDLNAPHIAAAVRHAGGPPLLLAGDLNTPAAPKLAGLADLGTARAKIDFVLGAGFEPAGARAWTELVDDGVSDHAAEDVRLRYAPAARSAG